jgi:ABC-2 type transport system ATP-binding protein
MSSPAIEIDDVSHRFGERLALDHVSFAVGRGELFGLLGPNGGGKTTLFRILSTLIRPGSGDARVAGASVTTAAHEARRHLGVVFQRPSLDGKLKVGENLLAHAALYRIPAAEVEGRVADALERLGLSQRRNDFVETLSGGLQRRVELAKALLHRPPILLLDEPSTGLDPGARRDFLTYLGELRDTAGVTVVLTTHYMEEAERCDRIAILHQGRIVRIGDPGALKAEVGGDVVVLQSPQPSVLQAAIRERFGVEARLVDGTIRVERPRGHEFVRDVVDAFAADITNVTFGKPTLEDVFVHATGASFWDAPEVAA